MARFRRKASRRSFGGFRARASRSRSSSGLTPMNVALAGAIYGVARPIIANTLPNMFSFGPVDSDNAIIGGLGFYGMKKTSGLMKALSVVALASEVGIVTSRLTSGTTSTTNVGSYGSGNAY